MTKHELQLLSPSFAVAKIEPTAFASDVQLQRWIGAEIVNAPEIFTVSRTQTEISVVCQESRVPAFVSTRVKAEKKWICMRVKGPLAFDLVGVISSLTSILAAKAIACFVFSTHDTDYIMVRGADCLLLILCNTQVKEDKVTAATAALKAAGHTVKEAVAKTATGEWACSRCTYQNHAASLRCAMCDTPKSGSTAGTDTKNYSMLAHDDVIPSGGSPALTQQSRSAPANHPYSKLAPNDMIEGGSGTRSLPGSGPQLVAQNSGNKAASPATPTAPGVPNAQRYSALGSSKDFVDGGSAKQPSSPPPPAGAAGAAGAARVYNALDSSAFVDSPSGGAAQKEKYAPMTAADFVDDGKSSAGAKSNYEAMPAGSGSTAPAPTPGGVKLIVSEVYGQVDVEKLPSFRADVSRQDCKTFLSTKVAGSYMLRPCSEDHTAFVLSYVSKTRGVSHAIIYRLVGGLSMKKDGSTSMYPSLEALARAAAGASAVAITSFHDLVLTPSSGSGSGAAGAGAGNPGYSPMPAGAAAAAGGIYSAMPAGSVAPAGVLSPKPGTGAGTAAAAAGASAKRPSAADAIG